MATITFSGLASGIDSSALIESLLEQKRAAQINPLEKRVTALTETNASFTELSELLKTLQSSAGTFRILNGGVLSKTMLSSDETKVTGTSANSASNGTYSLDVLSLAKNATHSFDDRFSSQTSVINSAINNGDPEIDRTVSYTIGSGAEAETVSVVLSNTTTASDFVAQFNSQSEKASASLVNVGTSSSPSYAIVINSSREGTEDGSISVSIGSGITDPNGDLSTADGAFVSATESAATDAQFTVSGIAGTITRSSNAVSDVLSGVSLTLQATGTATITIGDDTESTTATVQAFVDAYNEVINYIAENDTITREENGSEVTNIFGTLATTSLDENLLSVIRGALTNSGTSGRTVNILADLGITTARDGTLEFNTDVFKEAMASDSEGVRIITAALGEDLSAVDGKIAQYTRFNGLIDLEKTANELNITNTNNRISDLEDLLAREEESLVKRFSRLEALMGRLNSQQSALLSLLPSA